MQVHGENASLCICLSCDVRACLISTISKEQVLATSTCDWGQKAVIQLTHLCIATQVSIPPSPRHSMTEHAQQDVKLDQLESPTVSKVWQIAVAWRS